MSIPGVQEHQEIRLEIQSTVFSEFLLSTGDYNVGFANLNYSKQELANIPCFFAFKTGNCFLSLDKKVTTFLRLSRQKFSKNLVES